MNLVTLLTNAIHAKGVSVLSQRVGMILRRYGVSPAKMEYALGLFADILETYHCGASFPTTAIAVQRHPQVLAPYQQRGIEFCLHGYRHIDYTQTAPALQRQHWMRAQQIFSQAGLSVIGFRAPYLRRSPHFYDTLKAVGVGYVSNQPLWWDVIAPEQLSAQARDRYARARAYYQPWVASERLSIPRAQGGLIEIPVSLPDDEILIDRLNSAPEGVIRTAWLQMLTQSYARDELFTLQLHPERAPLCTAALQAVLAQARAMTPPVWIARLDEIATWWQNRMQVAVVTSQISPGVYQIQVTGPDNLTLLSRVPPLDVAVAAWDAGYQRVLSPTFTVRAERRPWIGLSPATEPALAACLTAMGYIVERADSAAAAQYALWLDLPHFDTMQEVALIAQIEQGMLPILRLGNWPDGHRGALAITGDIDALTLWDYFLRWVGR